MKRPIHRSLQETRSYSVKGGHNGHVYQNKLAAVLSKPGPSVPAVWSEYIAFYPEGRVFVEIRQKNSNLANTSSLKLCCSSLGEKPYVPCYPHVSPADVTLKINSIHYASHVRWAEISMGAAEWDEETLREMLQ